MNYEETFAKERKTINYYIQNQPELVKHTKALIESEIFKEIGISNVLDNRPQGYLRLRPEDFLVEEKTKKGKLIKITELTSDSPVIIDEEKRGKTLYAHLIKIGIPTHLAVERIAKTFDLEIRKIGYAGLKDADAITAQQIAFHEIQPDPKVLIEKKIPNIAFSHFYYAPGFLKPGFLHGNHFTITIRTDGRPDEKLLSSRLKIIKQHGFLNYYQSQRFGSPRLNGHHLGQLLCQGRQELAIKYFLFKTNKYDIKLIYNLRKEAEKLSPDWTKVKKVFDQLPFTFFNELRIVKYLIKHPDNFFGALLHVKELTQIWIYAYSSWLFNKYLSEFSLTRGCTDEQIPLLLSDDPADIKIYHKYLKEDQTQNFKKNLSRFHFIKYTKRLVPGRVFPQDIVYKVFNHGFIISFTLPKGAYATTFLTHLFELNENSPIPDWVNTQELDAKKILGQGDLDSIKKIFKKNWYNKPALSDFYFHT